MQLCHQFHNTIKIVLPYTMGMKVQYLEYLIDKLRMEKGLKGISEKNSLTFFFFAKVFKKLL